MVCVHVCLDPCSCVVDVGWERQESITSPGSGALQSTQEQEYTCQVQTPAFNNLPYYSDITYSDRLGWLINLDILRLLVLANNGIYNNFVNG